MSDKDNFLVKYGNKRHLDRLSNHDNQYVRAAVARKTDDPRHIERFIKDEHLNPRLSVAGNPNLTKEHFDELLKDPDRAVHSCVARQTPYKEHIDKLINHNEPEVRWSLAENPNLSKEHKDKLIEDPHQEVRYTIYSRNPTDEYSEKLLNDPSKHIRATVAIRSKNEKVLRKLLGDESSIISDEAKDSLQNLRGKWR